jgi:hypothetical protein
MLRLIDATLAYLLCNACCDMILRLWGFLS